MSAIRKIVHVPQYANGARDGTETMDEIALATYRKLGWEARPIRVRETYRVHGTIGCLCNVLRRTSLA
jgi:hypothetical protein